MEFKDGLIEVLNKQRSEEQTLTSEDMGVEKGKSREEKMVRTKAYGGKEGTCLGSQSNRAPTERKWQESKWSPTVQGHVDQGILSYPRATEILII